jgi:Tol biopolymer transport system component
MDIQRRSYRISGRAPECRTLPSMADSPPVPVDSSAGDRLDSWKEIAVYMRRDVKTVQRWEKREAMPVHRHQHDKIGSVFAFKAELDVWARNRQLTTTISEPSPPSDSSTLPATAPTAVRPARGGSLWTISAAAVTVLVLIAVVVRRAPDDVRNPLADARFLQLTDFEGIEQAAAISRDGKLATFLSDRDGQMDVWLTQVGSGEFHNLTRGTVRDLVNPSVRTLGFSSDGTLITFWARRPDSSQGPQISVWAVPVLGGSPRVYLDGAAEYDWSGDGRHLVYHTSGPGDPMFVRSADESSQPKRIFSAPAGLHDHFPLWAPDGGFIYFVQGSVPDRMDVWRIRPAGGPAERISNHTAAVSYPVFLDPRTLVYLSTDESGSGPWIYSVDVDHRVSRRASVGIDRYTSLSATADGRRLVATVTNPKGTLWRVPVGGVPAQAADAKPIALRTGNGSSPRIGNGFLLYVSSTGTSESIWKLQDDRATVLWSVPDTRVTGGPALARDGRRIAFATRRLDGQTLLWVMNADGTDAHTLASSIQVQGAPAWAPDGKALTTGALVDGIACLFSVPLDGRAPVRLAQEPSTDPAWSPNGDFVVFSGADVGTTFPVKAITADGVARRTAALALTRGARRLAFLGGGSSVIVLRGDLRHKDLWAVDLDTGAERQLTNLGPGFEIRDFDVTPDGREIVVEQVRENSDIVLLELPRR